MLNLNGTAAETDKSGNGTLSRPTSTVFGTNWTDGIGTNSHTHVAYCFAEVNGFSRFSSFTGNGSTNGPFVYTGFRPGWIMLKGNEANYNWLVFDSARNTSNPILLSSNMDTTTADYSHEAVEFHASGFRMLSSSDGNSYNKSGQQIIFMAFGESPLKYANAR